MARRIFNEGATVLLLIIWALCLLSASDATINVTIPFMFGSLDWINYFF